MLINHDKSESNGHPVTDRETTNWCVCSLRPSRQASREERAQGKKDRGLIKRGKLAALPIPFRHFALPVFPFTLFAAAK